jgi:phosphatidylserine/phosphatidylglycerophosphate/cardiolipin synthase-like enzyme
MCRTHQSNRVIGSSGHRVIGKNRRLVSGEFTRGDYVKLIVQPGEGTAPLIKAIKGAKKSIEIVIFRFDQADLEKALIDAVERGVFVHALIAFTNRGGEKNLRKLEMRFLEKGITVARTADDLVRYHGKMMLVDREELWVLAYNCTHVDTDRSRSFGICTRNAGLVQEAIRLFEADTQRQTYKGQSQKFIVSPNNARQRLTAFLKGAKRELLIYDVKISDASMVRILEERARSGVNVQIIGHISRNSRLASRRLKRMRLHARVIIRDRKHVFIGSQSLRKIELDQRREIGVIVGGAKIVNAVAAVFLDDWKDSVPESTPERKHEPAAVSNGNPKALAKIVTRKVPIAPVVKKVAEVLHKAADVEVEREEVKETVEQAVKTALKKAVKKAAMEVVERAS